MKWKTDFLINREIRFLQQHLEAEKLYFKN